MKSNICQICGSPCHPQATYCKRCKRLADRNNARGKQKVAQVRALKQAWDGQAFRCYYSGIKLVDDNNKDPRYLTFDHLIPRQESKIVACAATINDMKSDMSDREFWAMVTELAKHFNGKEFNEKVFKLKYWKR